MLQPKGWGRLRFVTTAWLLVSGSLFVSSAAGQSAEPTTQTALPPQRSSVPLPASSAVSVAAGRTRFEAARSRLEQAIATVESQIPANTSAEKLMRLHEAVSALRDGGLREQAAILETALSMRRNGMIQRAQEMRESIRRQEQALQKLEAELASSPSIMLSVKVFAFAPDQAENVQAALTELVKDAKRSWTHHGIHRSVMDRDQMGAWLATWVERKGLKALGQPQLHLEAGEFARVVFTVSRASGWARRTEGTSDLGWAERIGVAIETLGGKPSLWGMKVLMSSLNPETTVIPELKAAGAVWNTLTLLGTVDKTLVVAYDGQTDGDANCTFGIDEPDTRFSRPQNVSMELRRDRAWLLRSATSPDSRAQYIIVLTWSEKPDAE
jgi:hypothetical protein